MLKAQTTKVLCYFICVFILVVLFVAPRLKERNYIYWSLYSNQVIADTNNLLNLQAIIKQLSNNII